MFRSYKEINFLWNIHLLGKIDFRWDLNPHLSHSTLTAELNNWDTHLHPVTKFCYLGSIIDFIAFGDWVKNQNSQVVHQVEGRQGCCYISSAVQMLGMMSISETLTQDWPAATASLMLPDENYLVRQGSQHWGTFPSWNASSLNHGVVRQTFLGWTCCKNAWQKTAQRLDVWSTVLWCPQMRGTATNWCRFLILLVESWRIVVISGTVHWFWLKTSFHPLLWTSSGLTGSWKLSAYIRFGSLRSVKSVKTRGNWKPKKCESVKPNSNWKPKKLKSVKPNCKGDVEGVSCWFKKWKVLGNWQAKWQLKLKRW